jgi:hypothetical protein
LRFGNPEVFVQFADDLLDVFEGQSPTIQVGAVTTGLATLDDADAAARIGAGHDGVAELGKFLFEGVVHLQLIMMS